MKRYAAWGRDGSFRFKWMRDLWVWRSQPKEPSKELTELRQVSAHLYAIGIRLNEIDKRLEEKWRKY